MPLGVITEEQFNTDINKLNIAIPKTNDESNELVSGKVVDIKRGRGDAKEVPDSVRKVIAQECIESGGNHSAIADAFGVSKQSVAAYANGATSCKTYNEPDESLKAHTDAVRESISDKARGRLLVALEELTSEKIGEAKVRDIAGIAKDMSGIIKNMEPAQQAINDNRTQVVVYRPRMRDTDEFQIITVNE